MICEHTFWNDNIIDYGILQEVFRTFVLAMMIKKQNNILERVRFWHALSLFSPAFSIINKILQFTFYFPFKAAESRSLPPSAPQPPATMTTEPRQYALS